MQSDGQVVISTLLDTKQLEKQLKEQERQLVKYEKEAEKLTKTKVDLDLSGQREEIKKSEQAFDDLEAKIKQLARDEETYQKNIEKLGSDWRISNVNIDGQDYTRLDAINRYNEKIQEAQQQEQELYIQYQQQGKELNNQVDAYSKNLEKVKEINKALEENARNQAIIRGQIEQTNQALSNAKGLAGMQNYLKAVNKESGKVIKKLGKWVLALFGIRAMYGFIRNSVNIITENDEQLKADIEFMKTALAYSVEPIIRQIVEWLKLLFQYVAYIIKLWTGNDIFAKANDNLKKAGKSAKELKKQLAGFDEANVLQDKDSGGGVGTTLKELSPEDAQNLLQKTEKEIKKARGQLLAYQDELHNTLNDPSVFEKAYGIWGEFVHGISMIGAGIIDIFAGVWDTVEGLVRTFMDIITGDFDSLNQDFMLFISGILEIIGGFGETVFGLWEVIEGTIKAVLNMLLSWIYNSIILPIWNWIKDLWNNILNFIGSVLEAIKKKIQNAVNYVKGIVLGIFDSIKSKIDGFATKVSNITSSIKSGAKTLINYLIDGINKLINGMNKMSWEIPDYVPFVGGKTWGVNIPTIPRLASGGIVEAPKGVMMGSYIAGESGREGVLPLTNSTTMQELGAEIGKWVNIAIDNKMVVDGKVLATATNNQINKENFLMNR